MTDPSPPTQALLLGDPHAALSALRATLASHPDDWRSRYHLALTLATLGDIDAAHDEVQRTLALASTLAPAWTLLAALLHLRGDRRAARRALTTALDHDRACGPAWYALGVSLLRDGLLRAGAQALATALTTPLPPLLDARVRAHLDDLASHRAVSWEDHDLCSIPLTTALLLLPSPQPAPAPAPPWTPPTPAPEPTLSLEAAAALLRGASRVVALTGAGISADSGLSTRKQLWRRFRRDDAVSIWRFHDDPTVLWSVVDDFLDHGARPLRPNAAHAALARLPGLAAILTQNVDGLHHAACPDGRHPIIELHGTLLDTRCHRCGHRTGQPAASFLQGPLPPPCPACQGPLRPDVVLFGERVAADRMDAARQLAEACDLLLVVGCAMDVAPAADLPRLARAAGATILELNPTPTRLSARHHTRTLLGNAEALLPALLDVMST